MKDIKPEAPKFLTSDPKESPAATHNPLQPTNPSPSTQAQSEPKPTTHNPNILPNPTNILPNPTNILPNQTNIQLNQVLSHWPLEKDLEEAFPVRVLTHKLNSKSNPRSSQWPQEKASEAASPPTRIEFQTNSTIWREEEKEKKDMCQENKHTSANQGTQQATPAGLSVIPPLSATHHNLEIQVNMRPPINSLTHQSRPIHQMPLLASNNLTTNNLASNNQAPSSQVLINNNPELNLTHRPISKQVPKPFSRLADLQLKNMELDKNFTISRPESLQSSTIIRRTLILMTPMYSNQ